MVAVKNYCWPDCVWIFTGGTLPLLLLPHVKYDIINTIVTAVTLHLILKAGHLFFRIFYKGYVDREIVRATVSFPLSRLPFIFYHSIFLRLYSLDLNIQHHCLHHHMYLLIEPNTASIPYTFHFCINFNFSLPLHILLYLSTIYVVMLNFCCHNQKPV